MHFLIINLEINILPISPKILIAPLDWGMGHATRQIPLIKYLIYNECEIFIAADGNIRSLLQVEFPTATFITLKGYNVKYSKQKKWLALKIVIQIPNILLSISREHRWLKKSIKKYVFDAIISDNRFGLYNFTVPSIYITHQLLVKTGNKLSEKILQKIHYWFINKYTECWVPDYAGEKNLGGQLSHPSANNPANVYYIGCLSRFQKNAIVVIKYDLLILLSGPEPQRTIFEKSLLVQLKFFYGKVLFVRGLPAAVEQLPFQQNISIKNHLAAQEMNEAIEQSKIIISRAGYTTIMDLVKLQKKGILIPTPGQTEQEYLADYLVQKKLFVTAAQDTFNLKEAVKKAEAFNFCIIDFNMEEYKERVDELIKKLKNVVSN